jgi:cell shape-determining protein MreC
MHYQSRRNKLQNKYLKGGLILLGIFLICVGFSYFFGDILMRVATPFWQAENRVTRNFQSFFSFFNSKEDLIEENNELRFKVTFLEERVMNLERERGEESNLLKLYGRAPYVGEVVASVLVAPPQTPYDTVILDLGEGAVSAGSGVYLLSGAFVGVVSEVYSNSSRVKLFSTSGEESNAVLERGEIPIVLEGIGGGNFKITLPRDTAIESGDRILSPDIEANLIAIVEDVRLTQTDSFKTVLARSPANIFSLRLVVVRP